MKKFFFLLLPIVLTLNTCEKDDGPNNNPVDIPDTAFLDALIALSFDSNGDSLISYAEAEAVNSLGIRHLDIQNLKGIEAFVNLENLFCGHNHLTALNVLDNIKLKELNCYGNQLSSLDVTKNTALEILQCGANQLTSLDVSKNVNMIGLFCAGNNLTSLNITTNTKLQVIRCGGNLLNSLDLSNNVELGLDIDVYIT